MGILLCLLGEGWECPLSSSLGAPQGQAVLTFGLVSFGVKVEGRVLLVPGRLEVLPGVGAAVGLVGFLFVLWAAELGRLGLVVAEGLAFAAAALGVEVDAAGFRVGPKSKIRDKTKEIQQKIAHCKPKH